MAQLGSSRVLLARPDSCIKESELCLNCGHNKNCSLLGGHEPKSGSCGKARKRGGSKKEDKL